MRALAVFLVSCAGLGPAYAAEAPAAEIGNGKIRARFYLPDSSTGYYRGTRFDWAGVISSLEAEGHSFYGPWFTKRDPAIRDFTYQGDDIVAGACSSTMGPADEFRPVGYEAARAGGTFVKIGVGALRRPDEKGYDAFRLYEVADHGRWRVNRRTDSIEFTQTLRDAASGYGYEYRKSIRLVKGKSEMEMRHSLRNLGRERIETTVYNHNFLVLDGKGPGAGTAITMPFAIRSARPPRAELAGIEGNRIVYRKTLEGRDTVFCPVEGFGESAGDHEIRVENSALKAGMSVRGDRPLQRMQVWSIRSNVSVEPFIGVRVEPGKTFEWTNMYRYYSLR